MTESPAPAPATTPALRLDEAIAFLERGPATLGELLAGLDPAWAERRPAPDSWSAYEVACHLAYIEGADWMPRVRIILEHGDHRAFDPVDHGLQSERFAGMSVDDVVERFADLRATNLGELSGLRLAPADLDRPGRHPTLGPVTLGMLIATWVGHDLNHLSQIASALAYRYETAVGPWHSFLGILERDP